MTPAADESKRVNERIAADLRDKVASGEYEPGQKMPSVRQIAEQYDASAGTVSKALQLLSRWGVVRPDSTRGYFVQAVPDERGPSSSPESLALTQEVESIREEVRDLAERLRHLEERIGSG